VKKTAAQEIQELKTIISDLTVRLVEIERHMFAQAMHDKVRMLIKKEKA